MQKLIYTVFGLLLALVIGGFLLPRTHEVSVAVEIDAPAATVFALVNDFRRHNDWSTWADTDPDARIEYSGARRGEGAEMTWSGVALGSGSQRITSSRAFERIDIVMNPGEDGEANTWFVFSPGIGTTIVSWHFQTDYSFNIVGRYFASMLGGVMARDLRAGIGNLKRVAENLPTADFADLVIEELSVPARPIVFMRMNASPDPDAVATALRSGYFEVLEFNAAWQLTQSGAPLSIQRGFEGARQVFDAAIPVESLSPDAPPRSSSRAVRTGQTYAGTVIRASHIGGYDSLQLSHRKVTAFLAAHGMQRNGDHWEEYVSDPSTTPQSELLTYLYYPVRVD